MINAIIIGMFVIVIIFGLINSGLDLIGSSVYDFRQVKKLKLFNRHKNSRSYRRRPLVSVIIPAFNEEQVIIRCLESILKSSYRNYEIIVANDASKDRTAKTVKEFIAAHPKKIIKLVSHRTNHGRGAAINTGFKKRAKGEIIMALDADSTITKNTLKHAVRHFLIDDQLAALASNVRIMKDMSIIGLLQRYEWLINFRAKKINTVLNGEHIIGGSGAFYRASIYKKVHGMNEFMLTEDIEMSLRIAKHGNKEHHLFYASDVVVYTEPVPTYVGLFKQRFRWKIGSLQALYAHKNLIFNRNKIYSRGLTWYRLPLVVWSEILLLMEPIVYTYFFYLAILLHNPFLFLLSWIGISAVLEFAILGDDQLTWKEKLQFNAYIPIMYALFYVLTVVQILAMFRCLVNIPKITGRIQLKGNWTPPKRSLGKSNA